MTIIRALEFICVIVALSSAAAADSADLPPRRMTRTWDTGAGLPDSKVCALARTRDGYLWLGTPAGLARFDGVRFKVFDHLNTPQLENSRILSLHEDATGALWIGTDGGGLYEYEHGEWKRVGAQGEFLNDHVRALAGDGRGALWVGTEYDLHRLSGEEAHVFGLDEGLADNLITSLAADGSGRLWIGTMRGGLARIDSGRVRVYDFDEGLADPAVLSLSIGPDGAVWIGTMNGLFSLDPDGGTVRPVAGTLRYPVTSLAAGPGGILLLGTMVEGLKILRGASPEDLFTDEKLSDSHVRAILPDPDGFIWAGTESGGLVQLKERRADAISEREGLPGGSIYPLMEDKDGTLWIGTEKDGLYRMRGGRAERASNRSRGLAGDMVRSLMRDRSGALWVGTMDGGLSILAGGRIRTVTSKDGLLSDNVTAMAQDGDGAVWIGTDRGLCRYVDGRIESGGPGGALDGQTVRTLFENPRGVLYVGTTSGGWVLSRSSLERIVAEGDTTAFDALSLCEDARGVLWAGTNGGGLRRYARDGLRTFTTADGLPGNFIFSIMESDTGLLWISCEAGVFSIRSDSLSAYAEGATPMLVPTVYDDADGMPSSRCAGFCQPAYCESRFGTRLYPTAKGIAVLDGKHEPAPPPPPVALIEEILADDAPVHAEQEAVPSRVIRTPAGTDRIEIHFTAFDYSAPEKLRFLYRLEGRDAGFTPVHPGRPRTAVYHDLPPGEYEFAVRAVGNGGRWSERAATARFRIVAPFYRTKAFLAIVLAGIALAGAAVAISSKYRRIKKERMKYSTSGISAERMEKAFAELNVLMEDEKLFLDPGLTLQTLAQRLRIHPNHLSRIINERFGVSFNNFLNRYRIEEAKTRLVDPAEKDRKVTDIMYDLGFYSKSTFNTAFRKFTGVSPSEYRKKRF